MKFITQRALYYSFATCEIEDCDTISAWRAVAELFNIPQKERQAGKALLSGFSFAGLKTAAEVRLVQKCAGSFGESFEFDEDEQEALELKYHALTKVGQLAAEYHMSPYKAVASAYRRDPVATVLYVLQIFMHNNDRRELGYKILAEALSNDQNGDAGLLLLNMKRGDKGEILGRLAEVPEMIMRPEVLEELSRQHGVQIERSYRGSRIGF